MGRQSWFCSGAVGLTWYLAAVCPAVSKMLTSHGPQGSHHGLSYSSLTRCTLCVSGFRTVVGHLEKSPICLYCIEEIKWSGRTVRICSLTWDQLCEPLTLLETSSSQWSCMSCLCHGSQHLSHDINPIWRHGSGNGTQKSRLHLDLGERGVEGAVILIPLKVLQAAWTVRELTQFAVICES